MAACAAACFLGDLAVREGCVLICVLRDKLEKGCLLSVATPCIFAEVSLRARERFDTVSWSNSSLLGVSAKFNMANALVRPASRRTLRLF